MPPKKGKKRTPRTSDEDDHHLSQIDVQYNPEIVANLLQDLESQIEAKCSQMRKDRDFFISSIKSAYSIELIKIPKHVQEMSVSCFRDMYGDNLVNAAKGAMAASAPSNLRDSTNSHKENSRMSQRVFQTPSHKNNSKQVMETPSQQRNPREGEEIVSRNGSPLGEFTVKKAPRVGGKGAVPATPSVFVPLKSGEVLDLDALDVDSMSQESKEETFLHMQTVMQNMQSLMDKLKN